MTTYSYEYAERVRAQPLEDARAHYQQRADEQRPYIQSIIDRIRGEQAQQ